MDNSKEWRDVVGFEGKYKVSEDGDVYSFLSNRLLTHSKAGSKREYDYVYLTTGDNTHGSRSVHRLVCEAFNGSPETGKVCRHLDGKPSNNHYTNLAWGTPEENMQDAKRHGTTTYGEKNVRAKLTSDAVLEIRRRFKEGGITQANLGKLYGVSRPAVGLILSGQRWAHLPI